MAERASGPGRGPAALRVAVVLVALESLGLCSAGAFLIVETAVGRPADVGRALLGAALALFAAWVLGWAARALWRLRPAARSPVVVLQLLALPVSYSLGIQAGRIGYGGPIMAAALAVLVLLFTPPVRAVLDRDPS